MASHVKAATGFHGAQRVDICVKEFLLLVQRTGDRRHAQP